jgi:DNA modification methylase
MVVRAVADLIPYGRNPRTHTGQQVAQIAASISKFGWTNPILIGPDNIIIAGHGRWLAAQQLGMTEVPAIVLEGLTAAERQALIIADNRLALQGGWDEELLRRELEELRAADFDLHLLGFERDELADLWDAGDGFSGGLTHQDAAPEPEKRVVTLPGDLWLVGRHRLLCGDATQRCAVERLMAGEQADLMFSDGPDNVDREGHPSDHRKIRRDRISAEPVPYLCSAFTSYRSVAKASASLYVCHRPSGQREFQQALEAAGFEVRCQIVWAKNTFTRGLGRYQSQHEPIFYCHVAGENDVWYGDKTQSTLWQETRPAANQVHPAMKPVELVERAVVNSSRKGDRVVDLFGGSGSALIACQRTGRIAYLMEIDPRCCDQIVRRWQQSTGEKARLEGTDRSFDSVAKKRLNLAAGEGRATGNRNASLDKETR